MTCYNDESNRMPNLAYFEVSAKNVARAKKFYAGLRARVMKKAENPGIPLEYWMIATGTAEEGTVNAGGLYPLSSPPMGIIT